MMMKKKNNLDEMQEQKLLKIEHNGFWLAFWGLFIVIFVQIAIYDVQSVLKNIAGEMIVFMCMAVYLLVGCLKNGIWDRRLKPNAKTNILVSLLSSVLVGLFEGILSYVKYQKLFGSISTGVIMFIQVFILTAALLGITTVLYKKRVKKLEEKCDDDNK